MQTTKRTRSQSPESNSGVQKKKHCQEKHEVGNSEVEEKMTEDDDNLKLSKDQEDNPSKEEKDSSSKEVSNQEDKKGQSTTFGFSSYKSNAFQSVANNVTSGFGTNKPETAKSFGSSQCPADNAFLKMASSKPSFGFGKHNPSEPTVSPATASPRQKYDDAENVPEPQNSPAKAIVTLQEIEPCNGEEGERCILQLRAKLFRLSEIKENTSKQSIQAKTTQDSKDGDNVGEKLQKNCQPTEKNKSVDEKKSVALEWKEVGIGPARILVSSGQEEKTCPGRIVMRRETKPGGQGTKVILNTAFGMHMQVARHGEREVRLATVSDESSNPVSYLIKVKLKGDAEKLFSTIESRLSLKICEDHKA